MASNSLLALLNFTQPAGSPSSSTTAPKADSAVASSSASPQVASARSPSPTSVSASTAANALLQSILSPGVKPQDQFAFPEPKSTSVPSTDTYAPSSKQNAPLGSPINAVTPPSMSAKNSANDLLALLGGSGGGRKQPGAERSNDQRKDSTSLQRNDQKVKQRPIGTPPGQQVPRESTRSPVQSIFDSPSLFDMLQQASDKMSNEKRDVKSKSDVPREVHPIELPTAIASASKVFASNLAPSYPINPRLHASYHLSGLRASAGFEDSISSGLDEQVIDDTVNYDLDLTAPQPAGSSSLYPAKLEILPISVLTTPFSPSLSVDQEEGQRGGIAQWPCQRVGSLEGKYALYTMSKGRVRIINQENGFRHFARADTSGIRSIITPQHRRTGSRNVFAAITEGDKLYIWSMEGIAQQQDATVVATVAANAGKTFSYALWRPGVAAEELILVQSDGSVGVLPVWELERRSKEGRGALPWATSRKDLQSLSDVSCVGAAVSSDGSLLALVQASSPAQPDAVQLRLESLTHSRARYVVDLPSLSSLGVGQISFVSFADQGGNRMPQCLLIGYDSNQVIAVVDLSSGSPKQVIRFKASVPSFSLATWHAASSSLLLCCSMRSSIFSWRPRFARLQSLETSVTSKIAVDFSVIQGQPLNHSCEVIGRIKNGLLPCSLLVSQPFMKECALSDPYSSVALDGSSDGIHMIATHIGGIHGLHLPEEALKQAAKKEVEAETSGTQVAKASDVASRKAEKLVEESKKSSEPAKTPRPAEKTVEDTKKPNKAARKPDVGTSGKSTEAKRNAPTRVPDEGKKARQETSEIPSAPAVDAGARQQINGVAGYDVKALLGETEARIMSGMQRQAAKDEDTLAETVKTAFTSLLPKLEATTSSTVSGQVRVAVDDAVKRALPSELHQALLRPELVQHLTSAITSSIVPPVRKTAMDVVSQALAPHFEGIMADLQQSMETKMDMAVTGVRKDIVMEQSKALIGAEARIEQLTSQVETLTTLMQQLIEQNGALDKKPNDLRTQTALPVSAGMDISTRRGDLTTARHQGILSPPAQTPLYQAGHFSQTQQALGNYAIPIHGPGQSRRTSHTYNGPIMNTFLPQHLQPPPQPQSPGPAPAATMTSQELEDLLLAALSDPNADTDLSTLRSTLERIHMMYGSPSKALWNKTDTASRPNGRANVSQAVILTLLHRISKILNDRPDHDTLAPEVAVPWLEACSASLDRRDDSIASIFAHIQPDLLNQLIQVHRKLQHRASWWTDERLSYGILHYLR